MVIVKYNTENQKSALYHFHPNAEREQTTTFRRRFAWGGGTGETKKILTEYSRCPDRNSNTTLPEYTSEVLPVGPICLVSYRGIIRESVAFLLESLPRKIPKE
jgi:hypothetical protein